MSTAYHQDNSTMDVLSIIFFLVAGAWLIAALLYSLLVLCFLRMRSNGTLGNMYDEDFGRVRIGCIYIPLGCIFRRYARHLQMEEVEHVHQHVHVRFMTKHERRAAVQVLLERRKCEAVDDAADTAVEEVQPTNHSQQQDTTSSTDTDEQNDDLEANVCSICLCGYEEDEEISQACERHVFHKDCILDWLQLLNRTDCPCCRTTIVTEPAIYKMVKKLRKKKGKQERKEEDTSETEQIGEDEL